MTTEATFLWGRFAIRCWTLFARLALTDHTALIERTRPHRITRETAPAVRARTRVCAWCARFALRGKEWCARHAPGYAGDRRESSKRGPAVTAHLVIARDDYVAERLLPAELAVWAPITRLIAMRPRHTRPVKMFDVMRAFASRAAGDHAPWVEIVAGMRAAGIMRENDSPWRA